MGRPSRLLQWHFTTSDIDRTKLATAVVSGLAIVEYCQQKMQTVVVRVSKLMVDWIFCVYGDFFRACEDFGRMFGNLFPTCVFFFFSGD